MTSKEGMTTNGKEFSERLERVLVSDSEARFVKLVRDQPVENILSLVDTCAKLGANEVFTCVAQRGRRRYSSCI